MEKNLKEDRRIPTSCAGALGNPMPFALTTSESEIFVRFMDNL